MNFNSDHIKAEVAVRPARAAIVDPVSLGDGVSACHSIHCNATNYYSITLSGGGVAVVYYLYEGVTYPISATKITQTNGSDVASQSIVFQYQV